MPNTATKTDQHDDRIRAVRAKLDRGERLTRDERLIERTDHGMRMVDEIFATMKRRRSDPERAQDLRYTQGTADGIREAIRTLVLELCAVSMTHTRKCEDLGDRIALLEARDAARGKPKVKVKAGQTDATDGSAPK